MAKYIKKPVVVEAVQWNGENNKEVEKFCKKAKYFETGFSPDARTKGHTIKWYMIKTLEGEMKAEIGDYIVKGVKGEFYPVKPDIFHITYESVGDEEP